MRKDRQLAGLLSLPHHVPWLSPASFLPSPLPFRLRLHAPHLAHPLQHQRHHRPQVTAPGPASMPRDTWSRTSSPRIAYLTTHARHREGGTGMI